MPERRILAGEYAVLGLLSLRPMHGYEMACLLTDEGIAEVCPVEPSTLYTYLRNLEGRGLVAWSEERVGNRPPRKTFALTPAGQALTAAWLREPVGRMREVRLEFLLKLYFLQQSGPGVVRALLEEQVRACEAYLARLEERPAAPWFAALVAASKRSAAEGTLAWLRSYARELAGAAP